MQHSPTGLIPPIPDAHNTHPPTGRWKRLYPLPPYYRQRSATRYPSTRDEPVPEITQRQIEYRASRLRDVLGLNHTDYEDLVQDLTLEVLSAMRSYNPRRARVGTFTRGVLDNAYKARLRGAERQRERRRTIGLDDLCDDGAALIHDERQDVQPAVDLRIEIDAALALLPAGMQELARGLMTHGAREYAEMIGVHRGTVYRWRNELFETLRPLLAELAD